MDIQDIAVKEDAPAWVQKMHAELRDVGVTVVENVIPEQQCDEYVTELRQWIATFGEEFPSNIHSIIHRYAIAHHPVAWKARLHADPIFSQLWCTTKLHTSMDGLAIGKPPETGAHKFEDQSPGSKGFHLDQGPHRLGLHAFQGALYLEEATEEDWCFLVMEKSHKLHSQFYSNFPHKTYSEFRKLIDTEQQWYLDKGCTVKRVAVPKGGLVLWDSRLVHGGAPPIMARQNKDRWRFVCFISMTPAIWSSFEDTAERRHGYETLRCSRHWSSQGFSLFPPKKSTRFDVTELPEVAKSDRVRQLVGETDYAFGDGAPNGPRKMPRMLEQ